MDCSGIYPRGEGNKKLNQRTTHKTLEYRIDGNLLVALAPDDKAEDQKKQREGQCLVVLKYRHRFEEVVGNKNPMGID